MTSVYLAARFGRADEMLRVRAEELEARGVEVTSRWFRGSHAWSGVPDGDLPLDEQARFALEDLDDIDVADGFVCFTQEEGSPYSRGGRHVELGYALAWGKPIFLFGPRENVFYCHPSVRRFANWFDLVDAVVGLGR